MNEIRCDQAYHFIFVQRCWTSFRIELWMLMIIESLMIGVHLVRSYLGCFVFVDEMHSWCKWIWFMSCLEASQYNINTYVRKGATDCYQR